MDLPYLTTSEPGIGGQLKVEPEDFFVEEIPLYLPSGEGQHVYVEIEKRGLSTHAAINKIARELKISSSVIRRSAVSQTTTRRVSPIPET